MNKEPRIVVNATRYRDLPEVETKDAVIALLAVMANDDAELWRLGDQMDDARRLAIVGTARRFLSWAEDLDPNFQPRVENVGGVPE